MIVARYGNIVCLVEGGVKLAQPSRSVRFLEFFEGTDEMFIAKWKPKYPQYKFQIFKHNRKPLNFMARVAIESSPDIKSRLRDYNIEKLFT